MNWKDKFKPTPQVPTKELPEGLHRLSDGRIVSTHQAIAFRDAMKERLDTFRPETAKISGDRILSHGLPKVDKIP